MDVTINFYDLVVEPAVADGAAADPPDPHRLGLAIVAALRETEEAGISLPPAAHVVVRTRDAVIGGRDD